MSYQYRVQDTTAAGDILLLTLVPVRPAKALRFQPGQYAALSFKRSGRPTPARCFSIISTPASGILQFAMRIRGAYTQAVSTLHAGDIVQVQGAFGDFTINPAYDRRVVMLAGGIGITPFLSMIRDLTEQRAALPVTLLFSNRSARSIPFRNQLVAMQQQNPYLTVQFFASDTTGSITENDLRQHTDSGGNTTYFICGPKGFSASMQAMLKRQGVHESRIITESFTQGSSLSFGGGLSIRALTYGLSAATLVLASGFIMALDLTRAVPKLARAQAATKSQVHTATASSSTTTTPPSDKTSSAASSSTSTPPTTSSSTSTQNAQTQQPSYTYYQPPVSSVS